MGQLWNTMYIPCWNKKLTILFNAYQRSPDDETPRFDTEPFKN